MSDRIPDGLNQTQRRRAEEFLDRNPHLHGKVRILDNADGGKLPGVSEMHPIYHKQCGAVAFYYLHRPQSGEMLTATKAKFPDGTRPERGQPFICGSCKERIWMQGDLKL